MKNTKAMILCSMFTVLIIIGTFLKIPTPLVPITLQVTFVLLAGVLLGSKIGAMSSIIYLMLGLIGLPVFTGGGGLGYVLKPTFGYILGFIAGAFITGKICESSGVPSLKRIMFGNIAGIIVIYSFGFIYFLFLSKFIINSSIDLKTTFMAFVLLPLPSDIISCFIGAVIARRVAHILNKSGTT